MSKRQVGYTEVSVGNRLPWDVYDADNRLLLRKGHLLDSAERLEKLLDRGLFVDVGAEAANYPDHSAQPPVVAVSSEPVAPLALILDGRRHLETICHPSFRDGFDHNVRRIRADIAAACEANRSIALAATVLERDGRYSIRHAMDVAVVCHVSGSVLGFEPEMVDAAVHAALTMNLSMLQMQDDFQARKAALGETERAVIHDHPSNSVQALREAGVTDELWLAAVQDHHEAVDGSGYPNGKSLADLSLATRLVALADLYCAGISGRAYRRPLRPNVALRAIFKDPGGHPDRELVMPLIKALGVYPPGTAVRLENGELGIVMGPGAKPTTPFVCALMGPRGAPLAAPIKRDTSKSLHAVREVVDWEVLGPNVTMHAVWGKEASVS
jgi:HD-GYP domain-containing protein (c-di-GMP phosphodiesterase class II)